MTSLKCPLCNYGTNFELTGHALQLAIHLIKRHVSEQPGASLQPNGQSSAPIRPSGQPTVTIRPANLVEKKTTIGSTSLSCLNPHEYETENHDSVQIKSEQFDDSDSAPINIEDVLSTSMVEGADDDEHHGNEDDYAEKSERQYDDLNTSDEEMDSNTSEFTIDSRLLGGSAHVGQKRKLDPLSSTPDSKQANTSQMLELWAQKHLSEGARAALQASSSNPEIDKASIYKSSVVDGQTFYHCDECDYKSNFSGNIQRHVSAIHRKERNFMCQGCGRTFSDKRALLRHEEANMADPNDPEDAMECSKYTVIRPNVEEHFQDLGQGLSCNHCGFLVSDWKEASSHLIYKHRKISTIFSCNRCHAKFFHKTHILNDHWKNCGKEQALQMKQETALASGLKCPLCPYMANKQDLMERHVNKFHQEAADDVKCQGCQKIFSNADDLQQHMIENMPEPGSDYMKCAKISKVARPPETFVQQVSEGEFRCIKCKFVANNFNRVKTHAKQHTRNPYQCNLCKLVFVNRKCAVDHLKSFHNETLEDESTSHPSFHSSSYDDSALSSSSFV